MLYLLVFTQTISERTLKDTIAVVTSGEKDMKEFPFMEYFVHFEY